MVKRMGGIRVHSGAPKHLQLPGRYHSRNNSSTDYNEKTPLSPGLRAGDSDRSGAFLKKHRLHTIMILFWLACVIVYLIMVEFCIHAHELPPSVHSREAQFGRRGTPRRRAVVQAFAVARTVLTVLHLPILTATLATTLPALTQRNEGKKGPLNINAAQLFLLADRTWAGAGGWYEALMVGKLHWVWWKLFFVVLGAFLGFPLLTLGYETSATQFWEPFEYRGTKGLGFDKPAPEQILETTNRLQSWMQNYPQRNLGANKTTTPLEGGISYYPSAMRREAMQAFHFVTLEPKSGEGLIVASTLGYLQGLECAEIQQTSDIRMIDMSDSEWGCRNNCSATDSACHRQITLGKEGRNGHMAQVASCGRPLRNSLTQASNAAVGMELEVALKINPNYDGFDNIPTGFSFKAGDFISGDDYLVVAAKCNYTLTVGNGVVDSVIKMFMYFLPGDIGWTPADRMPLETLESFVIALQQFLQITVTAPMNILHNAFKNSTFSSESAQNNFNLAEWAGVQKSGDPNTLDTPASSQTKASSPPDIRLDNTLRLTSPLFLTALLTSLNSSTILTSPSFLIGDTLPAFTYLTDVKLTRGIIPIVIAPLFLLLPIVFTLYLSLSQWNTPTWTAFLDAFAMFRLGRDWKSEMQGIGAIELRGCEDARFIPGFVGDGRREIVEGRVRWARGQVGVGEEYVGHVILGGGRPMLKGVKYD